MIFRKYLPVPFVAALAVSVSAMADSAWEAKREALKNRPRTLILNSDGNEVVYYPTNLPVTAEGFWSQRLDKYRRTEVSTLSYCPWSSGFGLMTTTKAGEFFDAPIDLVKGCTNAAPLFAAKGLDSLGMTAEFCRRNAMEVFVSLRMNDTHDERYFRPGTNPRRSWTFPKWKSENPDALFGTEKKRPRFGSWTAVDYENVKVREYLKRIVSDLAANYDIDGIEYDFMRHGPILKSVGWGAYATDAQLETMTALMKDLRAITEAAGRRKGSPILVMVRTSDSVGYSKGLGIDIEAWLREGVMDIWSAGDYFQLDYLRGNVDLAHKYGVKYYCALAESRIPSRLKKKGIRYLPGRNTIASFAAEYDAAMVAGCDGVESFNLSCIWNTVKAPKLLKIDPAKTEDLDKTYFALVRGTGGYRPEKWLKNGDKFYRRPRIDPGMPLPVRKGETFAFGIETGNPPGKDDTVTAKVLFTGEEKVIDALTVNGRALPVSALEDGVHVFKIPYGVLVKGMNAFEIKPLRKDSRFADFAVYVEKKGKRK